VKRLGALPLLLAVLVSPLLMTAQAREPLGDRPTVGELPGRPGPGGEGPEAPGERPAPDQPPPSPGGPPPGASTGVAPGLGGSGRVEVARDHIVVRFDPGLPGWQRRQVAQAAGGAGYKVSTSGHFAEVAVAAGDSPEALRVRFQGQPGVLSAEMDPICRGQVRAMGVAAGFSVALGAIGVTFTDPAAALQWTFERIRLGPALDLNSPRGEGVIVAVLDSGVAFGNGAAFPARRGLDLEATRFLPGIDLVDGGEPDDQGVTLTDGSSVRFGHGTFVAAQIAATVNNGVAGGSIAPRATILPVRVLGRDNRGLFSDVAEGIDFAVARGAKVVNMSLGGSQGPAFLLEAIRRARAAGVVLVASAGNGAEEADFPGDVLFPARYPGVLAVGATAFSDRRASYSNFGPGLDVMAPAGENTGNFVAPGVRDAALAPSFLHDAGSGETIYSTFWANGTSFAAPQAAGAAALLISLGVDDPEAVRQLLLVTVRDLGAPGRDSDTGHGLLDLLEAHRGLGFSF